MNPIRLLPFVLALAVPAFADITIEKSEAGAVVKIDGQLFTEYVTLSENKPILWPILGPTGKKMSRDYPMVKTEGEKHDHPHHRSLWFTHGLVNGVDFWHKGGKVIHQSFGKIERIAPGRIEAAVAGLDRLKTLQ